MSILNEITNWWPIRKLERKILTASAEQDWDTVNHLNAELQRLRGTTQSSWLWCPTCCRYLNTGNAKCWEDNYYVYYDCKCGQHSKWDFGPPCPILIEPKKAAA